MDSQVAKPAPRDMPSGSDIVEEAERVLQRAEALREKILADERRSWMILVASALWLVVCLVGYGVATSLDLWARVMIIVLGAVPVSTAMNVQLFFNDRRLSADRRVLDGLVGVLWQFERTGELARLRSPIRQAEFRVRFGRFDIGKPTDKKNAQATIEDAKAYFERATRAQAGWAASSHVVEAKPPEPPPGLGEAPQNASVPSARPVKRVVRSLGNGAAVVTEYDGDVPEPFESLQEPAASAPDSGLAARTDPGKRSGAA